MLVGTRSEEKGLNLSFLIGFPCLVGAKGNQIFTDNICLKCLRWIPCEGIANAFHRVKCRF